MTRKYRPSRFIEKRIRPRSRRSPHLTLKLSEIKFFTIQHIQSDVLPFILQLLAVFCCLLR
ncbi:TPA: hypothetical protein MHS87_00175 [Klebsiella pneumoniae]|nr:hypothetical protein [Klebsiella pneumoniae]OYG37442.1 hypothetical protein CI648_03535 [Klebsiella pneumoniae subsp. pneumoniae]PXI57700.1 hypothetical protein DMP51_13070 [Klebsiella pneumoniae]HBX2425268.1 hypothetical protein [Klebsiella pneumoniae]HBX2432531.1 hypothetical protein [Klebsiella pneumoniae]